MVVTVQSRSIGRNRSESQVQQVVSLSFPLLSLFLYFPSLYLSFPPFLFFFRVSLYSRLLSFFCFLCFPLCFLLLTNLNKIRTKGSEAVTHHAAREPCFLPRRHCPHHAERVRLQDSALILLPKSPRFPLPLGIVLLLPPLSLRQLQSLGPFNFPLHQHLVRET